jgi:hypothetical protein
MTEICVAEALQANFLRSVAVCPGAAPIQGDSVGNIRLCSGRGLITIVRLLI